MHWLTRRVITKRYKEVGFLRGILKTCAEFKTRNNREVTKDYTLHNHSLLLVDSVPFCTTPSETSHEATAGNLGKVCAQPQGNAQPVRLPEVQSRLGCAVQSWRTARCLTRPIPFQRKIAIAALLSACTERARSSSTSAAKAWAPLTTPLNSASPQDNDDAFLRCTPMHWVICWRPSRSALVGTAHPSAQLLR